MKGLSTSLIVVVTAIVLLVVALVILTIFSTGISQFGSIAEAQNYCASIASTSCAATGKMPPTWYTAKIKTPTGETTCSGISGLPAGCTGNEYKLKTLA